MYRMLVNGQISLLQCTRNIGNWGKNKGQQSATDCREEGGLVSCVQRQTEYSRGGFVYRGTPNDLTNVSNLTKVTGLSH